MRIFKTSTGTVLARAKRERAARAIIAPLLIASLVLAMALSAQPGFMSGATPKATGSFQADRAGIAGPGAEGAGPGEDVYPSLTASVVIPENNTPLADAPDTGIVIRGRKTVRTTGAPAKDFTFTLAQVQNEQGTALSGAPVISPNPMTQKVAATGKGDYMFSFGIGSPGSGVYYFRLTEKPGVADTDWEYDVSEYIVKVTVDADGKQVIEYRSKRNPQAAWDEWKRYTAGFSYGAPTSENVPGMPGYAFELGSGSFTFLEDYHHGTFEGYPNLNLGLGAGLSNFKVRDNTSEKELYPMCADHVKDLPKRNQDFSYSGSRDHTESALFYALRASSNPLGLPNLSYGAFNSFLGINLDAANPDDRVCFMRCMVWIYEEIYRSDGPMPDLQDNAYWNVGTGRAMVDYMLYIMDKKDTAPNRAVVVDIFKTINKNIAEIMDQYRAGKTTSLTMSYTATGNTTGTIAFGHDGYVSVSKQDVEQYNTVLSWEPANKNIIVNVTRGNSTFAIDIGTRVYKTDTIEVINGSGETVAFTLTDYSNYLKAGTIKGDLLKADDTPKKTQPLLVGHAGFVMLKNTVFTSGAPTYLPFYNTWKGTGGTDPGTGEPGTGEPGTGEPGIDVPDPDTDLSITGRKTVLSVDAPATDFTFILTQVQNEQGAALTGTPAIDPNPMVQTVSTSGKGDYGFSFDIGSLESGIYYFKLTEQQGGAVGDWDYETCEYLVKVTVDENGKQDIRYSYKRKPQDAWGEWKRYALGFSSGVLSPNVYMPAYTFKPDHKYTFIDDYFPELDPTHPDLNLGVGKDMSTFRITDNDTGEAYYPMCADYTKNDPVPGHQLVFSESRNHKESALFFALRAKNNPLGLPALSDDAFSRLLGVSISHPDARVGYMRCMVWIYEEFYRSGASTLDLEDPAFWAAGASGRIFVDYMLYVLERPITQDNRTAVENAFKTIDKNTKEIMEQYLAGKTTSLKAVYTATSDTTGTIAFSHDGYVSVNSLGVEQYFTTLSWPAAATGVTVKVTRGGTTTELKDGVGRVYKGDTIEVTNNSGEPVAFTLADRASYLIAGTIKGDLLVDEGNKSKYQPALLGTAGFASLENTIITCGAPTYLPFFNIYKGEKVDPGKPVTIIPNVGGGGTLPFITSAAILSALLTMSLIRALIYRRLRRRGCIA